mmetsp:Transcript_119130/g.206142  ORF Transcript_119130/g.206142 Transcript_119130/m.206142 type:complete len:121 (+) Transcript_119130:1733-2095(+)
MVQVPTAGADETSAPVVQDVPQPPPGADLEQWVRESANPQERAQRARRVAELKVAQRQADDKARLAIFKSSGSAASSFRRDGHRVTRSGSQPLNPRPGKGAVGTVFKSSKQKSSTRESSM